ncbi:MAG: hypothetical protein ACYSUT_10790 [Planctomycetota bacterium]|jgi:hypothetical protein
MGELKIVISGDIGDLGPTEGKAVSYHWNPMYNVAGVLPWLLVAGVFVLFKENRRGHAWLILLPVLVFKGILVGINAILAAVAGMPAEVSIMFHTLADCLLIGFVMNWLLGERIGNRNRFVTWLLGVIVFAVVWGVSLFGIGTGQEAMVISIFIGVTVAVLMISFVLAGYLCRKKFGPVKFCLWTALWVFVLTNLLFFVIIAIQYASVGMGGIDFAMVLLQVLMVSGIYAGILIVALLPFEIILLANTFWRKRFEAVFGLKAPVPPASEEPEVQTDVDGELNHEAHEEHED